MAERASQYIPVWQFWLGVILIVMTASTTFGTVLQRIHATEGEVNHQRSRIEDLEVKRSAEEKVLYRLLSDISERIVRIETKLEERTK